ncbi:MAG: quinolinate synthase NadA [Chloroflexota bacterium]
MAKNMSVKEQSAEIQAKVQRIEELKRFLGAVVLAHNYQWPEVQDVADFVGDSLELACQAATVDSRYIVFCGVDFMAETAAVVNRQHTVLLPDRTARCPMAAMIDVETLRQWKARHPGAAVVCYVNSTAAVKAESDICCTSANAVRVVESLPNDEIVMVPDQNLANYVATQTSKRIIAYPAYCTVHHRLRAEDVLAAKQRQPDAVMLAHPECRGEVLELADAVLSTSQMLRYVADSPARAFLIGTESAVVHRMQKLNGNKQFFPVDDELVCADMKKTTLDSVIRAMELRQHVVTVPAGVREGAVRAIQRMLELL